jgi:TRAP-type C4-dicarboxylate transport system substrate-binding protein
MRPLSWIGTLVMIGALSAPTAADAQTSLRAISFIPKTNPVLAMANAWVGQVNKQLGGQVHVNYVGGPEAMDRREQPEALRKGVVDITFTAAGDYQDQVPVASAFVLSKLTPMQERTSGFYDFMVDQHANHLNAHYLGRMQVSPFYLWVKKAPKTLADLNGLKMRTGLLYDRMMRAFGMVPVSINAPEVYNALQEGIVDGFGWPVTGPRKQGWLDNCKYVIDLPFYPASNVVALMNLDKWKALPPATQDALTKLTADFEPTMVKHFDDEDAAEWQAIGDKVIKSRFSFAEDKRYLDTAYDVEWNVLQQRVPDLVNKLRSISGNQNRL